MCLDIEDLYKQHVLPYFSKFTVVNLSPSTLKAIDEAAEKLAKEKLSETRYRKDGASLKTRFKTGFKGEAAVGILLGIDIMDLSVGYAVNYDYPDIPGYSVGIKTVRFGNFPIITKANAYPQIICIVDPNIDSRVYVCGLATVGLLNRYQHSDLIRDPNLKEIGTKTGFYGLRYLEPVSLETIQEYKGGKSKPKDLEDDDYPLPKKRVPKSKKSVEDSEEFEDLEDDDKD